MPTGRPLSTTMSAVIFDELSNCQRLAGQLIGPDGFRRRRHHVIDRRLQQIVTHVAAQIAVGDDAGELAGVVGDGDAAEALGRHFDDRRRHWRAARDQRHRIARMHDVADEFECRAELAARMKDAEIDRGEAAAFEQRDRERIAERELHQRRRGRREIMRTSFARRRQRQDDIGGLAERALGADRDRDQPDAEPARIVDQAAQLSGLARPGQHQHHIVGVIMPRSPWLASAAWTKNAGVPVEASVAAILRAMWPDLPMPVTIKRPRAPANGLDGGDERRAQSVAHGRRQRRQALALGLQRAQRRGDERLAAPRCAIASAGLIFRLIVATIPKQRCRRRRA